MKEEYREKLKQIGLKYTLVPSEEHCKTGLASKHWTELMLDDYMALMESCAEEMIKEIKSKNFEFMETCVPDCDEARHARHEGSWGHYWEMREYLDEYLDQIRTNFKKGNT